MPIPRSLRRIPAALLAAVTLTLAATLAAGPAQAAPTDDGTGGDFHNMRQIAHHDLGGGPRGLGGEGFAELEADDGSRILYTANESGPVCFSVLDVTDPAAPELLLQVPTVAEHSRCNSLDVSGDVLVAANQVEQPGQSGAGVQVFNISDRRNPRPVSYFATSGPASRGVHFVALHDGRYLHLSTGLPDARPKRSAVPGEDDSHHGIGQDDQHYMIVDLADPARPTEVGRWTYPGTMQGDPEPLPTPNTPHDTGCRLHNVEFHPDQPDLAYLGYLDCGIVILDISDKSSPRLVASKDTSPPEPGFTHTVLPIHGGDDLVVTYESTSDLCTDFPKVINFVDARDPENLRKVSEAPQPYNVTDLCRAGGRFGAHNVHENHPDELAFRSETIIAGSFFNGGVRLYDISDLSNPREVAYAVPPKPETSNAPTIQFNDTYIDDRGVIFASDRNGGGLYVFRSPVIDAELGKH